MTTLTTLSDDSHVAAPTVRTPWDTRHVGNIDDAIAAEQRAKQLTADRDQAILERNAAITRAWKDDGLSQETIARTVGVSHSSVNKIVSGRPRSTRP